MKKLTYLLNHLIKNNNPLFWYHFKRINRLYENDESTLLSLQNEAILRLVNYAYSYSAFYKKYYQKYGIDIKSIKDISDIKKLPVLTKDQVRSNVNEILIGIKAFQKAAYTSGTSGSPLKIFRSYYSILNEAAYIWNQRNKFGHKIGMKAVSLRADLDRNTMVSFDPFSNTKFLSSYLLNQQNADIYIREVESFKPNAIYAFPSSVELLANFLLDRKKSIYVPLIFTSSETLYDFQREKIQKVFNTKIVDWYGNAERSIALEQNHIGTYDDLKLYSYNEFFEEHTLSTGLINFSFPLIRYKVDDIFIPDTTTGKVLNIIGRVDDAILLPDGTKVTRLGVAFKDLDEIRFAQIIQNQFNKIQVNVVPAGNVEKYNLTEIIHNLRKRIGNEMEISVNPISESEIIKTARGKYKLVICNLNQDSQIPSLNLVSNVL